MINQDLVGKIVGRMTGGDKTFQELIVEFLEDFKKPLTDEELLQMEKDDKSGRTEYLMYR